MAEFIAMVVNKQGPHIATEIVRELTSQIFQINSQFESVGIKNIGKFLSRLSKLAPKAIYLNIGLLLGFFDCEAYLLRQSLIKILGNILIRVFNPKLEPDLPLETRNVYNQTSRMFLELLMKRFHDKSSYCRVKVMKVFTKLIVENLVPQWMFMEVFAMVIGRLKDATVQVRKCALRLTRDMICVCGYLFSVNVKQGQKFLAKRELDEEKMQANSCFVEAESIFKQVAEHLEKLKNQVKSQYPGYDAPSLEAIYQQSPALVECAESFKKQASILANATNLKETTEQYGVFLTLMAEAGKTLLNMLSLKTVQDTVEVIRLYKTLKDYGIEFAEDGLKRMLTLVFSKEILVVQTVVEVY